ncbi:hypothetical protein J4E83_008758 [Alternaria metachromatica]|uniref:uncharacterized protein n=1 Tax=Alternaria metachromatica TaxID=283354 RepID=UPI0020C3E695|nr:uncharacterized protein J4E83_008758 [Alternaria metachromatica]KAI4609117.1 hypothetical protein J4E83_008758 [Alternaria metachromatica]
MAPLSNAVATYKQKRFDHAALEAMKAFDAGTNVPSQAKLNASDKAIIAQNPPQFNFSLWSGLPSWCIDQCFGEELAKQLVAIKLIKVEPRPVEKPPVAQHPAEPCLAEQRLVTKSRDFDLQVAEAAGFHRAMNIWNQVLNHHTFFAQEELRCQAALLAHLLAPYNIEDPSSLPGKFSKFHSGLRCPNRLQAGDPRDTVPQSCYYDEFLNVLNKRQVYLSKFPIV